METIEIKARCGGCKYSETVYDPLSDNMLTACVYYQTKRIVSINGFCDKAEVRK